MNFSCFAGHVALSLVSQCALGVDQGKQKSLPKSVIDVCRMVYQAKCSLIKVQLPGDELTFINNNMLKLK